MLKENPLFVNEESYASGVKQSFQEKGVKMTADKNSDNDSEEEEPNKKERETKKREKRMLPCLFSLPLTLLVK